MNKRTLTRDPEHQIQELTGQVEALTRELETFCYSVSHDLRAPLRTIRGFSEVIAEQYGSSLDDRGRDFLARIQQAGGHMEKLIDDLLKLSRVARAPLQATSFDLSARAWGIVSELRQAEPARAVEVEIAPDLTAWGDENLLTSAVGHLIRNAWKFTAKAEQARIEVGWDPARSAFFVRDNGAGFDMTYAGRLFGVFQRLHSPAEFSGSGVGLAMVKRIISRHCGRVWAEGRVKVGATFYFTLPESGASRNIPPSSQPVSGATRNG
jgi:light-regulated signal transduction histidine kinase (bacteriophytochrome)